MTQIQPYQLWIGHAGDGRDFRRLFDAGIQAVMDLALEETPAALPREFIYLRIPLVDGGGNPAKLLTLAVHSLVKLLQMHMPTLVVCGAGLSRAPSIAAMALAVAHHESPEACLQKVIAQHPHDVAPGFWQELVIALEHEPVESNPT